MAKEDTSKFFDKAIHIITGGTFLVALLLILLGAVSVSNALGPDEYNPFGEYPTQIVHAERNGKGMPVVSLSKDTGVTISGVKCQTTVEPLTIRGNFSLQFVQPAGQIFPHVGGGGTDVRLPGCTYWLTSENECPDLSFIDGVGVAECRLAFFNTFNQFENGRSSIAAIEELHAQGINPIVTISGTETPQQGGTTQGWTSEQFVIVP